MGRGRFWIAATFLCALFLSVSVAACGGDDDDDSAAETSPTTTTPAGGGETLKVTADPGGQLAYEQKSLSAKAGQVTIDFDNPSSIDHDVTIEDPDGTEVAATDIIADDTATATADLEAGSYTFFCSVDGHREAGMEGPLTVSSGPGT